MIILAIETSCDETAIALLEASGGIDSPQFKILKNIVSSQIKIHRPFGGVVPNLAKREHIKNLPLVLRNIFGISNSQFLISNERFKLPKIDLIAVTVGPGLEPALWAGITFAKEIQKKYFPKIPLVGVNHLQGHLYGFLLDKKVVSSRSLVVSLFPAIALVVSGGHTILIKMESLTKWKKLGETQDDAAGEAYDKVAKMLGLTYPGGPEIERAARKGNPVVINFPRPMLHSKDYNFSFSGLKTSVLYYIRDHKQSTINKADVAASFQAAAIDVLTRKTIKAVDEFGAKSIFLSGGVAANGALRSEMLKVKRKMGINFLVADLKYNTDNAVMIGVASYIQFLKNKKLPIKANGSLSL